MLLALAAASTMQCHEQRLAYYCQACSFAREGAAFFNEEILKTPKGVIIKELCPQHFNNLYIGGSTIGNLNHLSLKQIDTIDHVMKNYGQKTLEELDSLIELEYISFTHFQARG